MRHMAQFTHTRVPILHAAIYAPQLASRAPSYKWHFTSLRARACVSVRIVVVVVVDGLARAVVTACVCVCMCVLYVLHILVK